MTNVVEHKYNARPDAATDAARSKTISNPHEASCDEEQPPPKHLSLLIVLVEDPSQSLFCKIQDYGLFLNLYRNVSKSIREKEESILSSLNLQYFFEKITVRKCFIRNEDKVVELLSSKFYSSTPSTSNIVIPSISVYTAKMLSKHKVPNCIVHNSDDWQMYDRLDSKVNILDLQFGGAAGQNINDRSNIAIPHIPTVSSIQVRRNPSSLKSFLEGTDSTTGSALLQQQEFFLKDEFGMAGIGNRKVSRDEILEDKMWEGLASFVVQPYYAQHKTWAADVLSINGSVKGGIIRVVEPLTYTAHMAGCMSNIYLPPGVNGDGDDKLHNISHPTADNIWMHTTKFCEQQHLSGNYHFEFLEVSGGLGDAYAPERGKNQSSVMLMEINPRVSGVALYCDASGHLPWIEYSLLKYVRHILQVQRGDNVDQHHDGKEQEVRLEGMQQQWDLFDGNKLKKRGHLPECLTSCIAVGTKTCCWCMPAIEHILLKLCLVLFKLPVPVSYFILRLFPSNFPTADKKGTKSDIL